jgi:hypothetical protein
MKRLKDATLAALIGVCMGGFVGLMYWMAYLR